MTPTPHTARFESLGVALPERSVSSREVVESLAHPVNFPPELLEQVTGIRERRVCSEGEDSYTLARAAALDCLRRSRHDGHDLEMIISCSISRYKGGSNFNFEPPLSLFLKEALGASRAIHFDVANACAGMLTGCAILNDFIQRGEIRRGMVVSGEYISVLSDSAAREIDGFTNPQLASLTVGDSGAAVILERAENGAGISACEFATYSEYADLCVAKPCSSGPGAAMFTDARTLHAVAIRACLPTLERATRDAGVAFVDVEHVIPHQTSIRAIEAGLQYVGGKLGPYLHNVVVNLERYGNTSTTTHFLALHDQLAGGRIRPGDRVLLISYASGVVVGSLIFTMDELVEHYGQPD